MSEFKGTKGNWSVENRATELEVFVMSEGKRICGVKSYGKTDLYHDPTTQEADANAKLIAAAPDLLEALQEILRITDRDHVVWDKARKSIKKATEL